MDFYAILGIAADADEATIRGAYRILARRYHPDRGPDSSSEKFREIVEAYETLGDSGRRRAYDLSLQRTRCVTQRSAEPLIMQRPKHFYQESPHVFGRFEPKGWK